MAFYLNCKITVGELVLHSVNKVEIKSSWKELSDRCEIVLPTRGIIRTDASLEPVRLDKAFRTGMAVKVELGYDDNLITEFTGYVAEIKPGQQVTLYCEDETYKLKREGNITKSYKKTTLKNLLKDLLPGIKTFDLPDVVLENFLIKGVNKAYVLQELADKYGLAVYFRQGVLYAGIPYSDKISDGKKQITKYEIYRNVIEEDLKYIKLEDVRLKVRAVSILPNNKKVEVEVGDADGEERTLNYYNVDNKESLRKMAEADLKRYKYEGYRGSMTTFGIPYVQHGETVEINDPRYEEREGSYLIESVNTSFGTGGFRRTLEIAIKVSAK